MIPLRGAIVDLLTPFKGNGIDEQGFADMVEWQIREGADGIAACTTTGEGPTLTTAEKERLIRICVGVSAGRVPVIAATGTNGTESTVALTRIAQAAGADAALVVTPYYSRPSQEGLYRHFEAVARAVDLPIVLHNVPSRTAVDLLPATLGRLSEIASIVGVCDQTGDALRPHATARSTGERFIQLCGDDGSALAFNLAGGMGCISSIANVLPRACASLQRACADGHHDRARDIDRRMIGLRGLLAGDAVPATIKAAMALVRDGFPASVRLPLVDGSVEGKRAVDTALGGLLADPFWNHVADQVGFVSRQGNGHAR